MATYLVTQQTKSNASTAVEGARSMIVFANSTTQAKEVAAAKFNGDAAAWGSATVTDLDNTADWEGWTIQIVISTATPKVFTYTSTSTNDTIDEIAAALVTLINADADIAGAAYNSTTQVLKVAETTDGLGDKQLNVSFTPPGGLDPIASLVGVIVDGGASSDALTVTLPADALVPPKVLAYGNMVLA